MDMAIQFKETEIEIQAIQDLLQALEARIEAVEVISSKQRDVINDHLEQAWGLLEVHRHTCAKLSDLKEA
jgi:hypothetical protein